MSDREQIEELYRRYWQCMINKDIAGMERLKMKGELFGDESDAAQETEQEQTA